MLVETIAGQHPARPGDLTNQQYESCIQFLKNFRDKPGDGRIFTLNYDILLYWVLMHGMEEKKIAFDDGFRTDTDHVDAEYVVWDDSAHQQNVYYLHGALHLFDGGHELQKYSWKRTDIALIDQTREAIPEELLPALCGRRNLAQETGENLSSWVLKQGTAQPRRDQSLSFPPWGITFPSMMSTWLKLL